MSCGAAGLQPRACRGAESAAETGQERSGATHKQWPGACRAAGSTAAGPALPHLPLGQWGQRDPIGAVQVAHQHLQYVLNLEAVRRAGQTRAREKEGSQRETK